MDMMLNVIVFAGLFHDNGCEENGTTLHD